MVGVRQTKVYRLMKIKLSVGQQSYSADLSQGKSIAITLRPNGEQPNHFGAPECTSETLISGSFIGDTKRDGSCNAKQLTIIPHCNGTHTESISHIVNQLIPVYQSIEESFFPSVLVSIKPEFATKINEEYLPFFDNDNRVITKQQLEKHLESFTNAQLQGVIIRTLPNKTSKKSKVYDKNNYPVFLTNDAMGYLVDRKVKHIMVDFPSVDKMYDDGMLSNHRMFWNVKIDDKNLNNGSNTNKTITEMIFVDDDIKDGFYLCNLQMPEIETDAVPSRPVLYCLTTD